MAADLPPSLTSTQLHALFDILTHHETYREVQSFKSPKAITVYGYPFKLEASQRSPPTYKPDSSSPLLQLLLTRCVLTVPGMSDLPPDFWSSKFQGIMIGLANADLSESYDKGTLGTRKTIAALASVIHEAVTRGLLGGVAKGQGRIDLQKAEYDTTQASELARAWVECIHELVHGDLADELFDHFSKDKDFEAHSPAIKATVDYAILHGASLLHHILVLSPEGQYLIKLIQNVHNLVPYTMVRQTLRIGNAASMLNGMIKIFLAKISVGAVTNFLGLTKDADDGMNLMQRIISLVLSWDAGDFRKQAETSEASKDRPSKEQLVALREHMAMPGEVHEELRRVSLAEQKSIIAVILDSKDPQLTASLSEAQHTQCLEWYSAQLSVRDRDELIKVFCKSQPDFLTEVMRDAVATYEPLIRNIHGSLDLRQHVTSLETFLNDLLETSKPKQVNDGSGGKWNVFGGANAKANTKTNTNSVETRPPSVEDYVVFLRRNRYLLYKYLHQVAKTCTGVREKFRVWVKESVKSFRNVGESTPTTITTTTDEATNTKSGAAGAMSSTLQDMFAQLTPETRQTVLASLNSHATYLSKLESLSSQRMQRVLDATRGDNQNNNKKPDEKTNGDSRKTTSTTATATPRPSNDGIDMSGPGVCLMRWESLLDDTPITPATARGPIRRGRDVKGYKAGGKTGSESVRDGWDAGAIARDEESVVPAAPDVGAVIDALGARFREVVNEAVGDVGPPASTPPPASTSV